MTKIDTITMQARRHAELARQSQEAAHSRVGGAPQLAAPRKGSAVDDPVVDWSACQLAAAYPHWDEYIVDAESVLPPN